MKFTLPLIAASLFAISSLSACGGSGGSDAPSTPVYSPATLTKTDTVPGTGAVAVAGKVVKVHYTGYLYNATVADFKGTKFDTSVGSTPYSYMVGSTAAIAGFDQGVTGMKVGGKRTVLIPAALGYGSRGNERIPGNSGLVFDLELIEVAN
jgi:FKBP-type peptidyl-prolyl cis-trans isomerase FkpA